MSTLTGDLTNSFETSEILSLEPQMGENKISSLVMTAATEAGIGKRLTNHSARKYLVQKLFKNGVFPEHIIQISGHKTTSALLPYGKIDQEKHQQLSNMLVPEIQSVSENYRLFNGWSAKSLLNMTHLSIC